MISLPLFGKDSSPHRTSFVISIIATGVLWILLTISFVFIDITPKVEKYETIQIMLDAPLREVIEEVEEPMAPEMEFVEESENSSEMPQIEEVMEPLENAPALENIVQEIPIPEEIYAPIEKPVIKESAPIIENPEPKEIAKKVEEIVNPPKSEPAKIQEKPVEKAPESYSPEITKSVEELLAEQYANKREKTIDASFFDNMFKDDEFPEENQKESQKIVKNSTELSGSAGKVSETGNEGQTTPEKTEKPKEVTSSTSEQLNKISKTTYSNTTTNGTKSITSISSSEDSDGKVQMVMQDGSHRTLLNPEKPEIVLSDGAAKKIPVTCTIEISFTVLKEGHVPEFGIKLGNQAILDKSVQDEIIRQLSKWVFESSDFEATGKFEYTIVTK